jgi:hypothetical protein
MTKLAEIVEEIKINNQRNKPNADVSVAGYSVYIDYPKSESKISVMLSYECKPKT